MTLPRLVLLVLAVAAVAVALRAVHHSAPQNAPGVTGLTNAVHAAQGVVQQSQDRTDTPEP
jgi:hypothetical protein